MIPEYTLVFCQTATGVIMINRAKPPYRGLWNGLGGKLLPGETPAACAQREVQEECGVVIDSKDLHPRGLVHWFVREVPTGDLHVFYAEADAPSLPQATREGVVAAWPKTWLLADDNLGLAPDLPALLPYVFGTTVSELDSHFAGNRFVSLVPHHA